MMNSSKENNITRNGPADLNSSIPEYLGSPPSSAKLRFNADDPLVPIGEDINQHLPSYLSLACTVNGYSTTTNYDPIRLSKSRDASPLRTDQQYEQNTTKSPVVLKQKLLLSPDCASSHSTDRIHHNLNGHQSFSTPIRPCSNGYTSKMDSDDVSAKSSDTRNTKTFIQQRIERLYGPGALMQGFFITKQQCSRSLPIEDIHRDTLDCSGNSNNNINNVSLPVLRHLRPEFRAQLSISNHRKQLVNSSNIHDSNRNHTNGGGGTTFKSNCSGTNPDTIIPQIVCDDPEEKDGHYFLRILNTETERILKLADCCENELNGDNILSEDAVGKVRSAAGKGRLLVSQKMKQFQGLCANNINRVEGEAFPTTSQDLQGFWDMIMLQVDHVDSLFAEINKLKQNNWIIDEEKAVNNSNNSTMKQGKTKLKKPLKNTTTTSQTVDVRQQRNLERRKILEAHKKALKTRTTSNNNNNNNSNSHMEDIEIFVTKTG